MQGLLTENVHIIAGIYPVADAFAGTVYSDVVSMRNANKVTFLLYKGVGTTGTSTLTVEACSTAAAAATTAVTFKYRKVVSATDEDTWGAITAATTAGFTTAAASNEMYAVEVDAATIAATGYEFVRLKAVESANDPVLGGVMIFLHGLRSAGTTLPEAIA